MQRTQIYLQKTQRMKLNKLAQEKEMTISEVIRELINKGISPSRQKRKKNYMSLIQVAKHFEKLGEKGSQDLSKKMDTYLYGNR
ncbi:hypothetical protein HYW94_02750 [Candidatus Uhrbacteria bacterium]|nr:hypothetical protein [Candidatus Uhrbacteria bacterium]